MFGQTTIGSGNLNNANSRVYRIEIEGMRQNVNPDKVSYSIRNSGRTFISVPYNRMNEQLQRINRMGGKVLSIEPLTPDGNAQAKAEATAAHQAVNAWGKPKSTGADHPEAQESKKKASKKTED